MNDKWKRILELAALFLFCAATFLIVEEHVLPCAICLCAAGAMLSASRKFRTSGGDASQEKGETK